LKDEFSRKEVQISEMEFKLNNLIHQNQDVIIENERLRNELARLEELYGGKIHELENELAMETRNFEETTMQYNTEFEKFKKEGQDYVEQLTFEF
jgi:regulator of replication initiation timing